MMWDLPVFADFFSRERFLRPVFGLLALLMLLTGNSCNQPEEQADEVLLARVYDNKLYQRDIVGLLPPGTSGEDSLALLKRYIDSWVRQQVFLHHAQEHIQPDQESFNKKIEDYRNSLIIFAFENELVKQQLDTLVTEQQIVEYYEANQDNFKLREDIVKVLYVKVPLDAPEVWRLRRLYRSEDPDELSLLEDYCIQHAASYYIETDAWLFFQDLLREIPIQTTNPEVFLRSNKHVELTDNYFRYFLHVLEYRVKGSVSPLVLERNNVRNILLNIRRHAFINEQRDLFLQEAVKDGMMETYL
jgi:hypothetical protein